MTQSEQKNVLFYLPFTEAIHSSLFKRIPITRIRAKRRMWIPTARYRGGGRGEGGRIGTRREKEQTMHEPVSGMSSQPGSRVLAKITHLRLSAGRIAQRQRVTRETSEQLNESRCGKVGDEVLGSLSSRHNP